jgi:hypothetical protein
LNLFRRSSLIVAAASALAACTSVDLPTIEDRTLAYGCDDLVVIGRIQNGDFQQVEIEGDIIGHGWISGNVTVREVVKGDAFSDRIPIRYFAHTYIRDDVEFMFVLGKAEDGQFELRTAQRMSVRPYLATRCEPREA